MVSRLVRASSARTAGLPSAGDTIPSSPQTYWVEIESGDRRRSALVHLPPQVVEGRPLPLILAFHGGGGNARHQETYTGMDSLSDQVGFIVVYPNGTGRLGDRLLTWNAGTCCGYASDNQVDDVGFVRALVSDLETRLPIDSQRVYATGFSNGAMMAYRLAAAHA